MLDFEVLVIEVMDKILANVAKGYDILHFFFEFCYQDLILFNFHQLRLIQIKLLLKVNMLHLVPMILLQKTTLVQHHLEIYQLQLDLEIYLSTLWTITNIYYIRLCYSGFEQVKKTYRTLYIDVFNRKRAEFQKIFRQIVVCHLPFMTSNTLKDLCRK